MSLKRVQFGDVNRGRLQDTRDIGRTKTGQPALPNTNWSKLEYNYITKAKGFHGKTVFQSAFLAALLIFILVDVGVREFYRAKPFDFPVHSMAWWNASALRSQTKAPDLAVFGSSLVVQSYFHGEAKHFNKTIEPTEDHRSGIIEESFKKQQNLAIDSFVFGVPGLMASDQYALLTALCDQKFHPKLVVLAIAPRDFIDRSFLSLTSSQPARIAGHYAGKRLFPEGKPARDAWIEKLLQSVSAIFQQKENLTTFEKDAERNVLDFYFDNILHSKRGDISARTLKAMIFLGGAEELRKGQANICPNDPKEREWTDNSDEYKLRYLPYKKDMLDEQMSYFDKLLVHLNQLGVKVVVVNMPLMQQNMALLPNGVYDDFLTRVQHTSAADKAEFWNFNQPDLFTKSDFADTVHLNATGGEKLFELLGAKLAMDDQNSKALSN